MKRNKTKQRLLAGIMSVVMMFSSVANVLPAFADELDPTPPPAATIVVDEDGEPAVTPDGVNDVVGTDDENLPTPMPSVSPSGEVDDEATPTPSASPEPDASPSPEPAEEPVVSPSPTPTPNPEEQPGGETPSPEPSTTPEIEVQPSTTPEPVPTEEPEPTPTPVPTEEPGEGEKQGAVPEINYLELAQQLIADLPSPEEVAIAYRDGNEVLLVSVEDGLAKLDEYLEELFMEDFEKLDFVKVNSIQAALLGMYELPEEELSYVDWLRVYVNEQCGKEVTVQEYTSDGKILLYADIRPLENAAGAYGTVRFESLSGTKLNVEGQKDFQMSFINVSPNNKEIEVVLTAASPVFKVDTDGDFVVSIEYVKDGKTTVSSTIVRLPAKQVLASGETTHTLSVQEVKPTYYLLSLDGVVAFCLDKGLTARSGLQYKYVGPASARQNQIINYFGGFGAATANFNWRTYCQALLWSTAFEPFFDTCVNLGVCTSSEEDRYYMLAEYDMMMRDISSAPTSPGYYIFECTCCNGATHQTMLTNIEPDDPTPPEPSFENAKFAPVSVSASGTESYTADGKQKITLKKWAVMTLDELEGVLFDVAINNADSSTAQMMTTANGEASASWSIHDTRSRSWSVTSATYFYCTNYAELDPEEQALVDASAYYTSYAAAQAAAQADCNAKATSAAAQAKSQATADAKNALKNHKTTFNITENRDSILPGFNFIETQYTQSGSMTGVTSTDEGISTINPYHFDVENEPWRAGVSIVKYDTADNKEILADAQFDIYEWTEAEGKYIISKNYEVVRLDDGTYTVRIINENYVDDMNLWADETEDGYVYYTEDNLGKFFITETVAPEGYIRDIDPFIFQIEQEDQEVTVVKGCSVADNANVFVINNQEPEQYVHQDEDKFYNHRQYGDLILYKYDNEAEANYADGNRVLQGEGLIDGAVYVLIAKEPIVVNGETLFEKGDIVQRVTIGESYVTDEYGYILDKEGNRLIDTTKGIIDNADLINAATTKTPGAARFAQLELGEYYVVELQAAYGYLKDTNEWRNYDQIDVEIFEDGNDLQKYAATFTYEAIGANNATIDEFVNTTPATVTDNTINIVTRDETAAGDDNNLTMDDTLGDHAVYSGDFVQKQAAKFIKVRDWYVDTEKYPEEGAGFKIYLINDLAQVKDGTIVPQNGEHWTQPDIARYFYDYDFDVEKTAKVYKRQTEAWTAGDTAWLVKATDTTEDGYTDTLYRVGEMITDKNGYFETPELPFGQYVLVQTTWVEDTRSVQPVLVTITKDTYLHQGMVGDVEPDTTYGRILGNETTETFLRIEKTDLDAVTTDDNHETTHANSKRVESVLKPGATYKIKLMSHIKDFDSTVWRVDPQTQYMTYYDTTLNITKGTDDEPFDIKTVIGANGKIVDAYIELAYMLPVGTYELTELTAPEGFVVNGAEEKMDAVISDDGLHNEFEIVDAAKDKLTFTIDNDSVYPNGQMGDHDRNDKKDIMTDQYGRLVTTIYQPNQEQRGVFELYKVGEQLAGGERDNQTLREKLANDPDFREILLGDVSRIGDMQFEYGIAPIEGAVFEIYAAENIYTQQLDADNLNLYEEDELARDLVHEKDELITTITTDKYGYAFAHDLRIGKYYVKEVVAGDGFVLNETVWNFEISAVQDTENFIYFGTAIKNERQKVEIEVTKRDADTNKPVAGAVYALITEEDIYAKVYKATAAETPYDFGAALEVYYTDVRDGTSVPIDLHGATHLPIIDEKDYVLVLEAGDVVATAVSNEDGLAVFDEDLPLGNYKVVELEAPEGYTNNTTFTGKDEKSTEISIDATYVGDFGGQDVAVQIHNEETDELVFINQKTKMMFTKLDADSLMDISGAKFEIWEIAVDEMGRPIRENGTYKLAEKVVEWTSDRGEYAEFISENGFTLTEKVDKNEALNPKVRAAEDNKVKNFTHSANELANGTHFGHYVEGLKEGRQYILREVQAPKGYVGYEWSDDETKEENAIENEITEEIRFTVKNTNNVVCVDVVDQRTLGEIHITKEGEFLTGATPTPWDTVKNYIYTIFDWMLGRVQNAEFEVYVREDIYTPDNINVIATYKNSDNDVIELKKDTLVDTIKTDVNGIASIYDLPLGKYYIKEVGAGDGDFVINTEITDAELAWLGQEIPIVVNDTTKYKNDRQMVEITVNKFVYQSTLDQYSNEEITQSPADLRIPLEDAVFALVNAAEIKGYTIDSETGVVVEDPAKTIPAYTLIETFVSDKDGKAKVKSDLPCAIYYVIEIEAPDGYHTSDEVITVDARYKGQTGTSAVMVDGKYQNVLTLNYDFEDIPTVVAISKTDIVTGEEITGATLVVTDENGDVVDEWVSDGDVHYITNLLIGKTYTLTEKLPAPGYVTAEKVEFAILDKDNDGEIVVVQDVEMKDDFTKVTIRKESIVDGSPVEGAKLEIKDLDGKVIHSWTTDEDGEYEIEYLPIGKYVLTETYAPDGYAIAEDVEFEVLDTGEIQKVVMIDDVKALTVAKYELGTTTFIPGAVLQIIDKATGTVIKQFTTTDTWAYFQDLVPGDYILKEIKAPAGYVLTEDVVEFTISAAKEEKEVVIENDYTKVVIRKEHITNGTPLEGATLQIKDVEDNVLYEWTTDKTGEKQIDRLPAGEYTLVEITAPSGYYKAEAVKFTVKETGEIQKVVMKDAPIPTPSEPSQPANGIFYLSLDGGKTWVRGWGNWVTGENGEEGDSILIDTVVEEEENPLQNVGAILILVAVAGLLVIAFRKKKGNDPAGTPEETKETKEGEE